MTSDQGIVRPYRFWSDHTWTKRPLIRPGLVEQFFARPSRDHCPDYVQTLVSDQTPVRRSHFQIAFRLISDRWVLSTVYPADLLAIYKNRKILPG